jgi:hypothetical protein
MFQETQMRNMESNNKSMEAIKKSSAEKISQYERPNGIDHHI